MQTAYPYLHCSAYDDKMQPIAWAIRKVLIKHLLGNRLEGDDLIYLIVVRVVKGHGECGFAVRALPGLNLCQNWCCHGDFGLGAVAPRDEVKQLHERAPHGCVLINARASSAHPRACNAQPQH